MKNKRGSGADILNHNVIFIILLLIIMVAAMYFVISKLNGSGVMEEKYAKEIALSLDAAHPGMMITLNMSDAVKYAEKNLGEKNIGKIVSIKGNQVTVKLAQEGAGYTYSFFNNVNVTNYYLDNSKDAFVFFVGGYK